MEATVLHMRSLFSWTLSLAFGSLHAQQPNLATLLSLADCLDTTCVSQRLRPVNYCLKGGKKEDGWMWSTCGPVDQWAEHARMVVLGFFGYANSNYRDYYIVTRDSAFADSLTSELHRLGFMMERQYVERQRYVQRFVNHAYSGLEVLRLEMRARNVRYKKSGDLADPHALPMDSLGCDAAEQLQKMAEEAGYDGFEMTQELIWSFKVRVPTPHLSVRPSGTDDSYVLHYPVSDPVAEFTIKDLSGKVVFRSTTQDQRTVLDLSGLPNGPYYLTLTAKTRVLSKAFMKN